ncbi:MAG: hypothetical protein OIN66_14080 [Candidatus Methanoperedens sp.]|nr:hypothetical protein [Candidatus Methanoperedens sp.]
MSIISGKTSEKEQLINKIYELGFEVGYKNHSEIGWVLREYNKLISEAQSLGIQSPENYYNDGKVKGKANRDKGISEYSGKMAQGAATDLPAGSDTDADDLPDEERTDRVLRKPSIDQLPHLVEKISMIDIPKFLYGFKLLKK